MNKFPTFKDENGLHKMQFAKTCIINVAAFSLSPTLLFDFDYSYPSVDFNLN